ncbi:hypothetical protein H0R92_10605 [Treponema sp. OMZ 840]|uniref:hypothetical protein n=1 Tax=Treponema sp. OMZ 840 TaxID=244313 RepID=UPI003D925FDE
MTILKSAKHIACFILFAAIAVSGFSADFFSNTASGGAVDILSASNIQNTEMHFRGFYNTQIQIGERFLANTGISVKTKNMFGTPNLKDIPSLFNVDEISVMYRFRIEKNTAQFSLFGGEYEPGGSDIFARRYMGAAPFNSYLLQKEIGFESPAMVPIKGIGGAVTIKYGIPIAHAFYAYYSQKTSLPCFNMDVRIAGISNALAVDFIFGTSLPIERKDSNGNNVMLIIRRADFHAGLSLLLGDNPFVNVFLQSGVARIQTKPAPTESIVSLSDLYVFFEPRFAVKKVLFSLSMFHLPQAVYENIPYIDYPLGASFMIKSIPLYFKSTQGVFGGIVCASTVNPLTDTFSMQKLSVQFVPFAEFNTAHGSIKIRLPLKPLEYRNLAKAVSLSAAYTVRF